MRIYLMLRCKIRSLKYTIVLGPFRDVRLTRKDIIIREIMADIIRRISESSKIRNTMKRDAREISEILLVKT